jgi:predicted aldo/keto reductase-like oxidoreductase
MRYNLLENGGNWFPGNKARSIDQYDFAPCLANSPHADQIPALLADADRLLGGEAVQRLSQS